MAENINEYYRYGTKNEDGTVTWGDWQSIGSNSDDSTEYMPISGGTFTGGYFGTTVEVESTEIDVSKGSVFEINVSNNIELSFTGVPEGAASCFSVIVNIDENATSDIDITWPDSVEWNGKTVPTFKSGTTTILTFLTPDGGVKWFGSVSIQEEASTGSGSGGGSLTGTVGSETNFIWLDDGELKATTETVGSTKQPIYLDNGEFKEISTSLDDYLVLSTDTVGSETRPIYLSDGELKETSTSLSDYLPLSGGTVTGALTANGAVAAGSTLSVTGNTTVGGTLTASGAVTASSTLSVTGNTTVNGTLTVGTITNTSGVVINGATITSDGHLLLSTGIEIY